MRRWMVLLVIGLGMACGPKPEWVTPKTGGEPCFCTAVCRCQGMTPSGESAAEHERCQEACECPKCP